MKIGIITIFDNDNFGNRLQNYALQQILSQYAQDVLTIKNKPRFCSLQESIRRGTVLAESVPLNRLLGKRRKAKILEFQNGHIRTSRHGYCCAKTYRFLHRKDRCDCYCIGSDQVWNPELGRTGGFSFAGFAPERSFSYAASFGIETIPEENKGDFKRWLSRIPNLSLREDAGKKIVEELTGRTDARVLIDPTMLLPREEWDALAGKPEAPLPERYLLQYFLGNLSENRRILIQKKAEQLGLEIVDLLDRNSPFYEIGPKEFLFLIRQGSLICTDSFHASVFSFLYQRPLAIFLREGNMGSRLETFTRTFHLERCLAAGDDLPGLTEPAFYGDGFAVLEEERKKAKAYLESVFADRKKEMP